MAIERPKISEYLVLSLGIRMSERPNMGVSYWKLWGSLLVLGLLESTRQNVRGKLTSVHEEDN